MNFKTIAATLGGSLVGVFLGVAGTQYFEPQTASNFDLTPEREKIVSVCLDKLEKEFRDNDPRPKWSLDEFYYDNDTNQSLVKTAIQSGNFEGVLDQLKLLDNVVSISAFGVLSNEPLYCQIAADENGDLSTSDQGLEFLDLIHDASDAIYEGSTKMMNLVIGLRDAGQTLVDQGHKPVDKDAPVYLFR